VVKEILQALPEVKERVSGILLAPQAGPAVDSNGILLAQRVGQVPVSVLAAVPAKVKEIPQVQRAVLVSELRKAISPTLKAKGDSH
jgi:hypothetical protein